MISRQSNFYCYHTRGAILSTATFRAGIYNVTCEPTYTRILAHAHMRIWMIVAARESFADQQHKDTTTIN